MSGRVSVPVCDFVGCSVGRGSGLVLDTLLEAEGGGRGAWKKGVEVGQEEDDVLSYED